MSIQATTVLLIGTLVFVVSCGGSSGGGSDQINGQPNGSNGTTTYTVSTQSDGNGQLSPTSAVVTMSDTATFTIAPSTGYSIGTVTGCGGTLLGDSYTTDPIISACTVVASFVTQGPTSIAQSVFVKASNTDASDVFGTSTALNEDGTVLIVGAPSEASASGLQGDNSRSTGAVYVFTQDSSGWAQQSYLKPSNMPQPFMSPSLRLAFGDSVAVNDAGTTIAVAAPGEVQASIERGGVYIFDYINDEWVEQTLLKTIKSDGFGAAAGTGRPTIGIDGAGNRVIVGELGDSSETNTINGNETDSNSPVAGAGHVFSRTSAGWIREAYLKGSAVQEADMLGSSVAISGDGNTVALGALENSVSSAGSVGSVYVFVRDEAGNWTEQQRIKAAGNSGQFGFSVSLDHAGNTLAVGDNADSSTGNTIDADANTCCVVGSGAAYVFERNGTNWTQATFFKAPNPDINDQFGRSISINSNGTKLVIGALGEASNSPGINGDPNNNLSPIAGAAYVFNKSSGSWALDAYLKSANPQDFHEYGATVNISGNGSRVAVGSRNDNSSAVGINGDTANTSSLAAGAVYVYGP